ncbi:hypothetical protein SLS55_006194 [Diplodia seriata]|uniref:Uncharacterized protein n=1 Tax=Diplodia seriata TaxID=420778 RepID=A0ABR3CDI0_9PEZI
MGTTGICSLLNRTSLHDSSSTSTSHTADSRGRSMVTPPKFLRRDARTLPAIRSLPSSGNLVLFTPVVPPEPDPTPSSGDEGGAVQPPPYSKNADAPVDPFEPLGRAMSRHHSHVRHVPYVPSVGMTATHRTFLQHASAIVMVVVCKNDDEGRSRPIGLEDQQQHRQLPDRSSYILPPPRQSSTTPTQASFKHEPRPWWPHRLQHVQPSDPSFRFAAQVFIAAADLQERTEPDSGESHAPLSIPIVMLIVGEDEAESEDRLVQLEMLEENLEVEYDMRFALGPQTVLVSRSYSTGALTRVSGLIFGSDA